MDQQSFTPGWYPEQNVPGWERFWNGNQWTNHRRPLPSSNKKMIPGPRWVLPVAGCAALFAVYLVCDLVFHFTL